VPSYLSYVTGISGVGELQARRHVALLHAALFSFGFTCIFVVLGASRDRARPGCSFTTSNGSSASAARLVYLRALHARRAEDRRVLAARCACRLGRQPVGFLGSGARGRGVSGREWTPCIGPILGAILLYTGSQADLGRESRCSSPTRLGSRCRSSPRAAALEGFLALSSQRFRRYIGWVERVAGALLIVAGVMR